MSKTYKSFIKEYDMGITVPSMAFLKPVASMQLKKRDDVKLKKVREKWLNKAKKKKKSI
tara:strand:- start:3014 stop:3190 length:177 start_codon:yes stop_codon:yes gene_type:complete